MLYMLILLPPSETKAPGGDGAPVEITELFLAATSPDVTRVRRSIIEALRTSTQRVGEETSRALLGLRRSQNAELELNAHILTSPTVAAIERYTGVAFEALDVLGKRTGKSLDSAARSRLAVGSALWGVSAAEDPIPSYRLSASSKILPLTSGSTTSAAVTVRSQWSGVLSAALQAWQASLGAGQDAIIDLRSGGYLALGSVPGALTLRVETEYPDGTRKVVSHFNKHYKGLVARELALSDTDLGVKDLAESAAQLLRRIPDFSRKHFQIEVVDEENITLIVPA